MKDFIPYEPALALKELGFDEPCIGNYFHTKELKIYGGDVLRIKNSDMGTVTAPTFSQAFRWFREKYSLHADIGEESDWEENNESWSFDIYKYKLGNNDAIINNCETFNIYEEAELACLIKLIEIVKTKQL
jgi:hypothetical protein